jgi:hypothetical protein
VLRAARAFEETGAYTGRRLAERVGGRTAK